MTNTSLATKADKLSAMRTWVKASQIQRRGNRAIVEQWPTPARTVLVVIERDVHGNCMSITNISTLEQ